MFLKSQLLHVFTVSNTVFWAKYCTVRIWMDLSATYSMNHCFTHQKWVKQSIEEGPLIEIQIEPCTLM